MFALCFDVRKSRLESVEAFETHTVYVASNDWMTVNNKLGRV